jgi:hypothetical protein
MLLRLLTIIACAMPGKAAEAQNISKVYFDYDNSALSNRSKASLDSLIRTIDTSAQYIFEIKGFTDDHGTVAYNNILAGKRAASVKDYLLRKGVSKDQSMHAAAGEQQENNGSTDKEKRHVLISLTKAAAASYSVFGREGTEVIYTDSSRVTVEEFFDASTMLRDSMYALDRNDTPLVTAGMIRICDYGQALDKSGKFYTIKIPFRDVNGDSTMKVWLQDGAKAGRVAWQMSTAELTVDNKTRNYVFRFPVINNRGNVGCIYINMDKYCNRGCFLYLTAYKPFNFFDVSVTEGSQSLQFSAKKNDSTYIFSKEGIETAGFSFTGYFDNKSNSDSFVVAKLRDCTLEIDDRGNEHYYICDTCFRSNYKLPVSPPIQEKKATVKKRRTFFQRIGDFFRRL